MWQHLHRIRREQAATAELPIAQLMAITCNIHRDAKKQSKPFTALDFSLYAEQQSEQAIVSAEVAAVALALRHENRCPPLLLTAWPQILASVKDNTKAPTVRALHSDDEAVWVLAPRFENSNVRGGLVAVRGQISGTIRLRDLDRPLITYDLKLPRRNGFGWLQAGLLLMAET